MNGVWENLCPQFVHDFCGFEKVGEEAKEVLSNSRSLSKKLELKLQEEDFPELLAVHTRTLLMKTPWNWRPREGVKRDRRKKRCLKNWRDSGCRKWQGVFFTWGGAIILAFEALDLNTKQYTKVATAVQTANQGYHVVYDKDRKSCSPGIRLDHFCQRLDRIESSKEWEPVLSVSGMSWIAVCSCSWQSLSSAISHFLPLLQSLSLLSCSLNTSPCVPAAVLYYS